MLNFPRWKVWGISLICLVISLMAVPSFLPANVFDRLPAFARAIHVNLGLDLAGGSQLLLEAETNVLRVTGTDLELTTAVSVPCAVKTPGKAAVSARHGSCGDMM